MSANPGDVCASALQRDAQSMRGAGLRLTRGDLRCLAAGHVARLAINQLRGAWSRTKSLGKRMALAKATLEDITIRIDLDSLTATLIKIEPSRRPVGSQAAWLPGF